MSVYFHFKVDPNYLGAATQNEMAIVTFVQMYETIADQMDQISDNDISSKGIIAESLSQLVDVLSDIKKWEVGAQFYDMRTEYINIITEHYNDITRGLSSD